MIRFASLNQVLDPWVYILLRREVVWKLASTVKKLFSKQSKDSEINKFRRHDSSASVILTNDVQYSCCAFCWHCLCDPPQTQRRGSASLYSEYRRQSLYSSPHGSTNKLVMQVMRNVVIPDPGEEKSIFTDRRSQVINELKRQASIDAEVITQQPATPKDTRVKFYINGSSSFDGVETQILNKLDENEENEINSEDASL